MSPEIALIGCKSAGHDACPPVPVTEGAENVRAAGRALVRQGDPLEPHGCSDHNPHQGMVADGAPHIRIGGRAVARKNDPVACGPAQDRLAEGLPCVRAGNCGGEDYGRELIFGMLTSPQDKAILCLEEIALAEAARASELDRPGWLCLAEGIAQWLGKKGYVIQDKYDNGGQEPVFVEWDWLMQYHRFIEQYFVLMEPGYLFSSAAQDRLTTILKEDKTFQNADPNFYHTRLEWDEQRSHAFQNRSLTVPFLLLWITAHFDPAKFPPLTPDGLEAAVANVTILALADGYVEKEPGSTWSVHIEKVALFIHDGFEFEGDQILGSWDCENKRAGLPPLGTPLSNKDFRSFRERTGYGCDFRIMSRPKVVWEGDFRYDAHP